MTVIYPELFDKVETTEEMVGTSLHRLVLPDHFNGEWRTVSEVRPAGYDELSWMVKEHYLKVWPAIVMARFAIVVDGIVCGMIIYAMPPKQTIKRYGGMTWELARVWIHDAVPRNAETWAIAKSLKILKRHHPELCVVVSYADPGYGHVGTIYRAGNWTDDGMTDSERKSPRIDYRDKRTGAIYSRQGHVPDHAEIEAVPRVSKYRYIMRLREND